MAEKHTSKYTQRQTYRQTYIQTDRHTDRHTARHTGRLIEVDTYSAAGKAFSSLVRVLSLFSANPVLSSDF